jgi:hypothetical protein
LKGVVVHSHLPIATVVSGPAVVWRKSANLDTDRPVAEAVISLIISYTSLSVGL